MQQLIPVPVDLIIRAVHYFTSRFIKYMLQHELSN